MILPNFCRYFIRWKCWIFLLLIFIYPMKRISPPSTDNPFPYPESYPSMEYNRLQIRIDQIIPSVPNLTQVNFNPKIDSSSILPYSETLFRSASFPIIWLDSQGDVRWNIPAQTEMLNYLLFKQYPPGKNFSSCLHEQLFVLEQWPMGFFSRYHCFIEHFGQTLYSPSMTLLNLKRFQVSQSGNDDFLQDGILRYYQSFSLCSSYLHHPSLNSLRQRIQNINTQSSDMKIISHIQQLLERDEQTVKLKYSQQIWKFGYDHVPHRRWLFDRNRKVMKKILTYHSPIALFINHSNEHIYYPTTNLSFNLNQWEPRNSPQAKPRDVLPGTTTQLTIEDQIFSSFLRYMFLLFFSPLAPRIQTSTKLLAHHWSEYLSDKWTQPYEQVLINMAALFIRRGDKMPEDSFWTKHQRWRNISMYVKGIVDEEKRREKKFSTIFIMTDDTSVMNSIQEYAREGLTGTSRDESYAREHLYQREILYNVFAPQSCFNPFIRIGFDQFLVNMQFLGDYASFIVGHTDSNVGRYLEEIIYVHRQHEKHVQTRTFVVNAPDSLD